MQNLKIITIATVMGLMGMFQSHVVAATDYPAAYFEPYIVYQAPEIKGETPSAGEKEAVEPESESQAEEADPYPAAYFQPVIVYQDQALIAAQKKPAKPGMRKGRQGSAQAAADGAKPKPRHSKATPPAGPIADDGGFPISVLVLILALAGGFYWFLTNSKMPEPELVAGDEDRAEETDSPQPEEEDSSS